MPFNGVYLFLLYSGGIQIICSSDNIIDEYLSIATCYDHSEKHKAWFGCFTVIYR